MNILKVIMKLGTIKLLFRIFYHSAIRKIQIELTEAIQALTQI